MNWLLDIILVLFAAAIIFVNIKKGCKSFLKMLSPIISFACAFFFGPALGVALFGVEESAESAGSILGIFTNLVPDVQNSIASALGCVVVFIAARLIMFILTLILGSLFELGPMKIVNSILGVVFGILSAFIYTWIICVVIGIIIDYNLIGGEGNNALKSIASSSYIFRFFCNLSIFDFVNIAKMF